MEGCFDYGPAGLRDDTNTTEEPMSDIDMNVNEETGAGDLARDALLALLNEGLRGDTVYTLDVTTTLPVMENKGYRQRPVDPGEFLFDNVRAGARGARGERVIFSFRPVDSRPFKWTEFTEKNLCSAFPAIEERIVHILHDSEPSIVWSDERLGGDVLRDCVKQFLQARTRAITKTRKANAQAIEKEKEKTYEANPSWGIF